MDTIARPAPVRAVPPPVGTEGRVRVEMVIAVVDEIGIVRVHVMMVDIPFMNHGQ
jgi:hypothetical protein